MKYVQEDNHRHSSPKIPHTIYPSPYLPKDLPLHPSHLPHLERRIGVDEQLLKVSLEPSPRLRSRLQRILKSAMRVISVGRGIAGPIGLAAGLHPDDRVDVLVARVAAGPHSEPGVDDVAPVALLDLGSGLHAAAACVKWWSVIVQIESRACSVCTHPDRR